MKSTTTFRFSIRKLPAEWRTSVDDDNGRPPVIWLITYKKVTGEPRVEYHDAVEEALFYVDRQQAEQAR